MILVRLDLHRKLIPMLFFLQASKPSIADVRSDGSALKWKEREKSGERAERRLLLLIVVLAEKGGRFASSNSTGFPSFAVCQQQMHQSGVSSAVVVRRISSGAQVIVSKGLRTTLGRRICRELFAAPDVNQRMNSAETRSGLVTGHRLGGP